MPRSTAVAQVSPGLADFDFLRPLPRKIIAPELLVLPMPDVLADIKISIDELNGNTNINTNKIRYTGHYQGTTRFAYLTQVHPYPRHP